MVSISPQGDEISSGGSSLIVVSSLIMVSSVLRGPTVTQYANMVHKHIRPMQMQRPLAAGNGSKQATINR